jgi:hypothetical protein
MPPSIMMSAAAFQLIELHSVPLSTRASRISN